MSRCSAIKVLDHAMSGPEGTENCQKFVDILGLRSIFPLFMKTPKVNRKVGPSKTETEGIHIRVVSSERQMNKML
jgi:beta-catenin-like protein 1